MSFKSEEELKKDIKEVINDHMCFDHNYMNWQLLADDYDYFVKDLIELIEKKGSK